MRLTKLFSESLGPTLDDQQPGHLKIEEAVNQFLLSHRSAECDVQWFGETWLTAVITYDATSQEIAMIENKELKPIFRQSVEELPLGVRSYNVLKNANLRTIADVVVKTRAELLRMKNLGKIAFAELRGALAVQGLRIGMTEQEMLAWVPPNPAQPLFTAQ